MKLCKDCKYLTGDRRCGHDSAKGEPDYLDGRQVLNYLARSQRTSILAEDCGHDARFFEARA